MTVKLGDYGKSIITTLDGGGLVHQWTSPADDDENKQVARQTS